MPAHKHPRRVRLIRPGLQLRLILTFLGVSSLALALQFILFMSALTEAAVHLPQDVQSAGRASLMRPGAKRSAMPNAAP